MKDGVSTSVDLTVKWTSTTCLEGSGLNDIFYWYVHPTTLPKSLPSFAELSFGSRTREKREVSSAKIFTLHSRLGGMSLIKIRNNRGPKLSCEGHPLVLSAIQMHGHLKPLFEVFQNENYWIDITKNLRYHETVIWKLVPPAKPYQRP